MRKKDDKKKEALFEATIKLVNQIGFASISISRIANLANVSPATIYVFFKNKEDLLISTYVEIKLKLCEALIEDFDDKLPIRDIIKNVWFRLYKFISNNMKYYAFLEQFANSPYISLVEIRTMEKEFSPIITIFEKGIEQKIIKNVDHSFLIAFMFNSISCIVKSHFYHGFELNKEDLEIAFNMAWDAIRL